jgi:glycosidase
MLRAATIAILLIPLACGPTLPDELAAEPEHGSYSGGKADNPAADGPAGIAGVKAWATTRVKAAEAAFAATGTKRMPSPASWADEVVYQIQVDRFNDGDPSNNGANVSDWQRDHRYGDQRGLPDYHHGGDLQGIIDRLDYLAGLGVTTLWVTPVLKGDRAYHGYCTSDFTQVDPAFGTAETLRTLAREAHQRGLRVVLDIVVNHLCSRDTRYDDAATPFRDWAYGQCVDDLNWRRWHGGQGSIRGQRELRFGPASFAPFRSKHFFSRCGYRPGDFAGAGNGALFGDFSDRMLDLDTMNWDLQEIFSELHKYWIAYADLDGYRVDAAKHVTEDFLAKLSTELRAYARGLGKQNFLLVGEVAASTYEQALRVGKMRANPADPGDRSAQIPETLRNRLWSLRSTYLANPSFPLPGLNAVYDFGHSGTAVDVFHGWRPPLALKSWFWAGGEQDHQTCAAGYCELAANGDPRLSWNVIEIHDWPRFAQVGRSLAELSTALGYLLTAKGTPVLYYGVEQGLDGTCPWNTISVPGAAYGEIKNACTGSDHARYRQDMFLAGPWRLRSVVPAIDALARIGFDGAGAPASWQSDPYLDRSHNLYRYVRRLLALRRSCRALRQGEVYFRAAHGASGGLLASSRIAGSDELLVVVNTGSKNLTVDALHLDPALNAGKDFSRYTNLLNGYQQGTVGKLGTGMGLHFSGGLTLPPWSVAVFAHESNVTSFDAGLGAHRCVH